MREEHARLHCATGDVGGRGWRTSFPGATLKVTTPPRRADDWGSLAADEVSLLLATQFRTHAATYQTHSAKAAVIHEQ